MLRVSLFVWQDIGIESSKATRRLSMDDDLRRFRIRVQSTELFLMATFCICSRVPSTSWKNEEPALPNWTRQLY